ncbi:peroxisome proliferator-activated receptor gamma coactivator-related protein 1 [Danio aesculapii]|uniref:peroxisome proliferator-activated receptor gamma coactivator-related protein 1 n=1 Tax=Danio aesculapii TaxID=1142201 RepID=UPI0024BF8257|nr:peroxisome proliferator-activated receptor gamma coactivator-related protein 1 [Danio aesculapii]
MAARWGTGEDVLKVCNTQLFSNLDEAETLQGSFTSNSLEFTGFNNGDALEALHGCLDSSILSIFEDSPTGEVKSDLDEESEATLLTALTEILDNVDDENLSPFDTLPDSDLFSGHKGQEHSPLRKLFTRSTPESVIHTRQFPGKSLPRMQRLSQQNSEGEEEEDGDASFSIPLSNIDLLSLDGFDWCLPVSLEQDGESMPISLSELVKHMHPYCMTLCVEGEEGQEHLLPERGLVLEVVDQGEHGEPILAIPDLSMPLSQADSTECEQSVPENRIDKQETKHDDHAKKVTSPSNVSPVEKEKEVGMVCIGKKRCKSVETPLVEQRILRSSKIKEEPQKKPQEEQKKKKVTFSPSLKLAEPERPKLDPPTKEPEPFVEEKQIMTSKAETKIINLTDNKSLEKPVEEELPSKQETPSEQPSVCQRNETKPKPLSLQQYRLLRQQKKPDPVDKTEDYSTKWPTLPEAPKELPPIPCLPEPSLRDPRKTSHIPVKKDPVPEIMPAWHPRGPAAPPTPEALLVPPASLMGSSRKPVSSKSTSSEGSSQSVHPSPLKQPAPITVQQNTIHTETLSPKRTVSQPVFTTPKVSTSLKTPSQEECLHGNPNAAHAVASSKVSLKPQMITTHVQSSTTSAPKPCAAVPAKRETEQVVLAPVCEQAKTTPPTNSKKLTSQSQPHVVPIAAQPFFTAQVQARVVELAEQMRMASSETPKPKTATVELIESFTSEIGIEAADLTSLLEQFEESQPKEEPCVPEVCGRAAAVGNSSFEQVETKALGKTRNHDLGSTAGLTPPATPPHQMWKPIAPVSLLGKTKKSEVLKSTTNKAIQIEARPLPSNNLRSKPQTLTGQTQPFSLDHDYCLPPKEPSQSEVGSRWNVKQQSSIVIKTVELPSNKPLQNNVSKAASTHSVTEETQKNLSLSQPSTETSCTLNSSVLETPDASPNRPDSESSLLNEVNQQKSVDYSKCSSTKYQQDRGRQKRRCRAPSTSSSDFSSESSSRSRSPPRKRYRSRHSSSRSSSSSRSRSSSRSFSPPRRRLYSYSSSPSGSWSRSRSRSRSRSTDPHEHRRWRSRRSPDQRPGYHHVQKSSEDTKRRKEKAIEERRVVYVGRICGNMTRMELKERFLYFGDIEECTVHFRENGDNYGFVTYYSVKDAFNAIENGSILRKPNELPFDLCFGGRRQFCKASYADLDSNREYDPKPTKGKFDALDFDTLLKQAQKNLKR